MELNVPNPYKEHLQIIELDGDENISTNPQIWINAFTNDDKVNKNLVEQDMRRMIAEVYGVYDFPFCFKDINDIYF